MLNTKQKLRLFFLKKQNAILTFIVLALGIMPSCAKKYGTESVLFQLNGNIKSSSTNQPIKQVSISGGNMTTRSDSAGNYILNFEDYNGTKTFSFTYKDTDSTLNGNFKDKDTTISFNGVPNYTKTVDVHLDPK